MDQINWAIDPEKALWELLKHEAMTFRTDCLKQDVDFQTLEVLVGFFLGLRLTLKFEYKKPTGNWTNAL